MPAAIFLDTAIAFLKRYRALLVILPLCLALAWQTYQVSRWKGREAKAQATIAQMQLASEQARAAQLALNNQNAQLSQRIATDAIARRQELAALCLITLAATGCARTVTVAPAEPILPPCIQIPAHLLDQSNQASWLPSPATTLKPSPVKRCADGKRKPS